MRNRSTWLGALALAGTLALAGCGSGPTATPATAPGAAATSPSLPVETSGPLSNTGGSGVLTDTGTMSGTTVPGTGALTDTTTMTGTTTTSDSEMTTTPTP